MKTNNIYNKGGLSLSTNVNIGKLELIEKALGKKFRAQVGVLGSSIHNRSVIKPRMATERNAEGIGRPSKSLGADKTNAEIGAEHEFGVVSRHLPARSFLWMPLSLHLNDAIQAKASVFNRLMSLAEIPKMYATLGILGENVVQAAFQTGGFGQWQKLSQETIDRKGSEKILIDTAQLRKSITSRVV